MVHDLGHGRADLAVSHQYDPDAPLHLAGRECRQAQGEHLPLVVAYIARPLGAETVNELVGQFHLSRVLFRQ